VLLNEAVSSSRSTRTLKETMNGITIPAFNNLSTTNLNDFAPLRFAIRNALDLGPQGFSLVIHCHRGLLDEREHLRWLLKEFHFEIALLLIEQWKVSEGVDFSNCDINGLTPLMSACWSGNEHILRSILQGAGTEHVNDKAKNGQTALHIAAAMGIEPIVSALIDAGANTETTDREGLRPLHEACSAGKYHIVSLLIDKGANFRAKTKKCDFIGLGFPQHGLWLSKMRRNSCGTRKAYKRKRRC